MVKWKSRGTVASLRVLGVIRLFLVCHYHRFRTTVAEYRQFIIIITILYSQYLLLATEI